MQSLQFVSIIFLKMCLHYLVSASDRCVELDYWSGFIVKE